MARTKLNDGQLEKLVNADKVSGAALNLTGSDVSALTTLTGGDHFLVQSGSAVPKKITADSMQDFFSKVDIAETSANSSYQILFVNDDTGFVEASFSAFQTSRMQESTVTNSTSALTFSPEYGTSSSSGDIIRFKDSGGNEIAFTVSSSVTSSATSVSVAYHSGASNATSMSKSSISSVVTLTAGSGDGVLRVDGSHLNYNPSSNLLTIGGDISVGDDILMTSDGAVLSLGDGADVTLTHDGSNGAAIAAAGAFDIDAGGALTLDGSSITIGGDSDVAVDFDSSTFDLDASGALTMDSAAAVTITGATGASLNDDTEGLAYDGSGNVDFDAVALDIDASGAITIDGATTLSLDAAGDSNLTVTASGKDLDIAVAGGSTQELRIASAGTGPSALHLNASAGGMNIDVADMLDIDVADEITIDTTSADGHIALTSAHTAGQAILISANADAGAILDVDAGIMDVDVQGAYSLDASGVSIDSDAASNLSTSAGDLDISSAAELDLDGATVKLDSAGQMDLTAAAALNLISAAYDVNASGVVGIDSDAAMTLGGSTIAATADGGALSLTTTDAAGDISLVSAHTAGVAFHIDANANASSEVQIDAGILDVDVTGAATIDAGEAMTLTAAGIALAGGSSEVDITTSGALDLNSGAMTLDASTISLDGSGALNIDTSDTSNGIALGTATSGVPISIGHSTSLVTVNDNLTVTGDLIVNGDTVTVSTANLLVEDPIVVLNKANASANGQGGIAIELGGSSSDMVIGRVANDTWGVGTKDTSGGTVTTLADMTLGALRAGKLEIDGASDHIDVSTDMIITAAADVQFAPGGGNVLPSTDSTVSLGKAAALGSAASFSAFQTNRLQESSLTSSTTSFTFSPEFGTTVSAGDVVIFTDSSSNTLAFAFSSAVGSSATNVTVAYSSGNSNATSMSKSAISSVTKRAMASGAWATLYVDNIDLDGQGRIDLDDDQDTSIRASADDVITFEAGGADEMSMSTTALYPATDDGLALGSANQNWSDLFLADEAVLSFGDDQDVTLTHVADTGILMSSTDQFQFGDSGTYIHQAADGQLDIVSDGNIDLAVGAAGVIVRGTTPKVTIGDAGAEDTFLVFDGNAQDYRIGLDDGTDVLEFGVGATHGTTTSLKMDASLNVDVAGHNGSSVGLKLGGTIVAATATELSVMDGDTSATSTTVATGDRVVFNDAGTMKQVSVDQVGQYYGGGAGIQASSAGVLSITCVADIATSVTKGSILTSDLKTGSLSQNMVSGSLQVFLNGMLQTQSGSVEGTPDGGSQGAIYDYHLLTTTGPPKVRFEEALDGDDVLQLRYIKA